MARAIWSGSISFGLVNVPVKLYSAVSRKTVRFHQLHDEDGVRIRQKRVCPADDEEVPYEHVVKGHEIAKDKYVVIRTKEYLAAIRPTGGSLIMTTMVFGDEVVPANNSRIPGVLGRGLRRRHGGRGHARGDRGDRLRLRHGIPRDRLARADRLRFSGRCPALRSHSDT